MARASKKNNEVISTSAYDYTKDIRSYLKSTLFNSYYLEKGFVSKFKKTWVSNTPEWEHFYQGIFTFIESKDASFFLDEKPSESLTIDSYIKPIMALLGWDNYGLYNHYDTETTYDYDGKPYRPDLVYFNNLADQKKVQALKSKIKSSSGKKKKSYQDQLKSHVEKTHSMLLEAKMFGLLKNNSRRKEELKDDSTRDKSPEGQTVTYMQMLRSNYAILTDGGIWKFFHNEFRGEDKYVTFDFGKLALWLIKKINLEGFEKGDRRFKKDEEEFDFLLALFYNLFSKEAILGEKVAHLVEHTKRYSEHLEDKIKNRFVMAVTHACNGLAQAVREKNENPDDHLDLIKKTAESHLFNIIFFRSLESRGVLPYFGEDNSYDKLSISKTIDSIYENGFSPSQSFKSQLNMFEDYYQERVDSKTSAICNNLIKLYKAVHKGISNGIHIEGFKESVFTDKEWQFANTYKIPDEYMMNVIFYLNLVPKDRDLGEYQLIPYDFLTPRELGSIFESFLEFKIEKAKTPLFWDYNNKQWLENNKVKTLQKSEIIKRGEYYFSPNNEEKKMQGAYYTPDYIVSYIVEKTLSPICKMKSPKDVLNIKVCDPSMGSGHFLKGVIDYLTERYIESHYEHNLSLNETREDIIRKVLNSCIYGVDINPSAVKLAKMSMWLITASMGNKLEMLDNRLINSDALTYYKSKPIKFDAFVGNPPYINSVILSNDKEYKAKIKEMYTSAKGAFDICSLFFEACNKISSRARIGFVLPNKLLSSENSRGMREYIVSSEEIHLEQVDDISTVNVFKDASVYPIILITGTQKTQNVAFTYHDRFFHSNVTNKTVPSEYNAEQADKFFENFSPHNALEFDSVELGDICELKGAATVGEAYEFKPAVSEKSTKNSLKFVVSGNIFGYGNSWRIQKTQYIKDSYLGPLLNLNNAAIPKKRKDQYLKEKVIVPNMTTSIKAFYDSGNFAPAKSTTMVFKKDISLKVIAAYINSKVANDLYKRMFGSQHLNGGALRVGPPQLKKLPFPKSILENKGIQKRISTLHDQVSKLVEKAITAENAKFIKSLTEDKSLNNFKEITEILVEIDSIFENAAMEQEKAA